MIPKFALFMLLAFEPLRQLTLFQKTLIQFRNFFSIGLAEIQDSNLVDDKNVLAGGWTEAFYRGEWSSNIPQQFGYISKTSGPVMMHFDNSYDKENTLEFYFEIYENEYVEDKYFYSSNQLAITGSNQTSFTDKRADDVFKINKVFSLVGQQNCTSEMTLNLIDKDGKPMNISTDDLANIWVNGSVVSQECGINFTFKVAPKFVDLFKIVLFSSLAIAFVVYGMQPMYQALRENNISSILHISEDTFLFNIMVDVVIVVVNMTIATRVLIEYFEFLTLITMFLIISILFKMRFMFYIFEIRLAELAPTEQERAKKKLIFHIKFVLAFIILGVSACLTVHYYAIYYLLFLYPLFQIWYNCFNVLRRNCFMWRLHFQMIVPQVFYPIALRVAPSNLFHLHSNYTFGVLLLALVLLQIGVMFGQKYFGPSFFLPNFLNPTYFNYFKKLKNLPNAETVNCPICFIPLTEQPELTPALETQLTSKKYMETPCKHQFHQFCLQKWMDQRMICPCCRARIPPY